MAEIQQSEIASAAARARQLGAQAHQLAKRGDWIGALEPARQAVEQWRVLAGQDSPSFVPELARSLQRLAMYLTRTGLRDEAFKAANECVMHWRQLAAANPDGFDLELAHALQRLAPHGDRRWFLSRREEATNLLIRLAATNPALLPEAAEDVSRVTEHFFGSSEHKKALQYGRQEVELWRVLAAKDLVQFGGGLTRALRRLAVEISPGGADDKQLLREARRIAISRIFSIIKRSLRPKAIGAAFAAAATGKALRGSRPALRRGG
jgi:tetratricopeptide (TPR) repeat protein